MIKLSVELSDPDVEKVLQFVRLLKPDPCEQSLLLRLAAQWTDLGHMMGYKTTGMNLPLVHLDVQDDISDIKGKKE